MPTGSLCAERNVIGSALADDLTLKRHHIKMVAVLSVSLTPFEETPTSPVNMSFSERKRTISNAAEYPDEEEMRGEGGSHSLAAHMAAPMSPSTHRRTSSDMTVGSPPYGTPKSSGVKYRNLMALDLNTSASTDKNVSSSLVSAPLYANGIPANGRSVLEQEDEEGDDGDVLDVSDTWRAADGEILVSQEDSSRRRFSTGETCFSAPVIRNQMMAWSL